MKLGEEACIKLDDVRAGRTAAVASALCSEARRTRRAVRAEVIDPRGGHLPAADTVRSVSDAWLNGRHAREKGFSVAAFDAGLPDGSVSDPGAPERQGGGVRHLHDHRSAHRGDGRRHAARRCGVALCDGISVHQAGAASEAGRVPPPEPRHGPAVRTGADTPGGGLAPASAICCGVLASDSTTFAACRTFKSKFDPDWQPRYLAASGTVGPFLALADLARLGGNRS